MCGIWRWIQLSILLMIKTKVFNKMYVDRMDMSIF